MWVTIGPYFINLAQIVYVRNKDNRQLTLVYGTINATRTDCLILEGDDAAELLAVLDGIALQRQ